MLRCFCFLLGFVLVVCSLVLDACAQSYPAGAAHRTVSPWELVPPGLILTGLAQKDRERFRAIEEIVFAEDENFQPLHPTLRGMWEWVETSGHSVLVEAAPTQRILTCLAGSFTLARFDPSHRRQVAILRLNLSVIDQAQVGPTTARPNGFVPFLGLGRAERYAEVLGHELAHTIHILTDQQRTRAVEEMVERTNELLRQGEWLGKSAFWPNDLRQKLARRDQLLGELERQAEAMEEIVWRELKAGQPLHEKLRNRAQAALAALQAGRK